MRRRKHIVCACVVVLLYWFFGLGDYLFARSYDREFNYPLDIDLRPVVREILSGGRPTVEPINSYPYVYLRSSDKCADHDKIDLLILVKSAMEHSERREAIRATYGRDGAVPGKVVKTVFFLGSHATLDDALRERLEAEMEHYSDIVQSDFEDEYYNMTVKTMLSFRWAYEHCATADHYLFTDDDMYVSVRNLLAFVASCDHPDGQLVAGYVFESAPQRFHSSKWRVSLDEYPWDRWPPYVTAGAYVVSKASMRSVHVASAFVKHFRFDDVYLGIVARKLGIALTHSAQFHFYKKRYSEAGYADVIASHGYGDPQELTDVWRAQNERGG